MKRLKIETSWNQSRIEIKDDLKLLSVCDPFVVLDGILVNI